MTDPNKTYYFQLFRLFIHLYVGQNISLDTTEAVKTKLPCINATAITNIKGYSILVVA